MHSLTKSISQKLFLACCFAASFSGAHAGPPAPEIVLSDYPTIQAAIDANPGKLIHVPAGDYIITSKITINKNGAGLSGPGRIIQSNPDEPIIVVENASGTRLSGLTLMRPEGKQDSRHEAVNAVNCRDIFLTDLSVIDNHSNAAAISVRDSRGVSIRHCLVRNYTRISVDDRTGSEGYGYAFKCIDGTGISVAYSNSVLVEENRVVEENLLPTPETQKRYDLGRFTKKNATRGKIIGQQVWDAEQVDNWHQGSGIVINAPEVTDAVRVVNNDIENAAQGMDIHADHVTIQGNIINNAFIGMKAMHGSRNVLIIGNQFIKNDLWSIGLMPGAASHPALPAADGKPAVPPNVDGGSIIANNIISDFGRGNAHWIWRDQGNPLRFENGQMPDDPALREVLVEGNLVFHPGLDELAPESRALPFRYAVRISAGIKGLHFSNNVFQAGSDGVSNVPLPP